jgi:hypothetical protein
MSHSEPTRFLPNFTVSGLLISHSKVVWGSTSENHTAQWDLGMVVDLEATPPTSRFTQHLKLAQA